MKKYHINDSQPYQYHLATLTYEYPNDNDQQIEFTRFLGVITLPPQTVEAVLAEYFIGEPLAQLSQEDIAQLSPEMLYKMSGTDLIQDIYDFTTHDKHGCIFSIKTIQNVSFEQFNTLMQFAEMKVINMTSS